MRVFTMKLTRKIYIFFLNTAGYFILLIQQIPSLWIWVPFMAAPVILILGGLISNFPISITEFLQIFFMQNEVLLSKILIFLGLAIIFVSIPYLGIKKKKGLVISGPYRVIRHPQYTGFLLLTIGFTGWSYFYITNFFGIGWISADATIILWYVELLVYFILAFIEENYLSKEFGLDYINYKKNTPAFIPFIRLPRFDIIISIVVFSFFLYAVIQFPLP